MKWQEELADFLFEHGADIILGATPMCPSPWSSGPSPTGGGGRPPLRAGGYSRGLEFR